MRDHCGTASFARAVPAAGCITIKVIVKPYRTDADNQLD